MEVSGKIKVLGETQTFGSNGFRKREVVVTTDEQYPQMIMVEFIQDKCDLLNNFAVGDDVKININLRGREWINPEGVAKYFNSIQGWRIEKTGGNQNQTAPEPVQDLNAFEPADDTNSAEEADDLPF
jgi:translation initiation factor IF-3